MDLHLAIVLGNVYLDLPSLAGFAEVAVAISRRRAPTGSI